MATGELKKEYKHKYYMKNRKHIRQRDNETRIKRWLFKNGGFCWICGELDPRYLEEHHIIGKEDNLTINLCANCHRMYRSTKGDNHKLFILRRLSYV